jgi:hypothetical protein
MASNQGYSKMMRLIFAGLRMLGVISGEVGLGLVLRWASTPALSTGNLRPRTDTESAHAWTLAQLVVATASQLAWIALALLVGSTLVTILLVPVQQKFASVGRVAWLGGPVWWRRAVLGACGLSLVSPVAASAVAPGAGAQHHCTAHCAAGGTSAFALSGLQLPDLPATRPPATEKSAVVRIVRRGDSLWLIARGTLPPAAPTASICRRVDALYTANRAVIGPDPDLIFPGMQLTQPGGTP